MVQYTPYCGFSTRKEFISYAEATLKLFITAGLPVIAGVAYDLYTVNIIGPGTVAGGAVSGILLPKSIDWASKSFKFSE